MSEVLTPARLEELTAIALYTAEEAAALALAGHRTHPRVDKKSRCDLVTDFDRANEELLIKRLHALTPGIPVVGEEQTAETHGPEGARPGLVWYVDPIDGTTNFVHGHPFWCVAVGLMAENVPVVGAVVAPAIGVRWKGWIAPPTGPVESAGTLVEPRAREARRNGEPCSVSSTETLSEALLATGFPPVRDMTPASNFTSFMAVKRTAQAVRRCGSAAMDLCMVADGTYDGYWERRLHAWDTVAASAVVLAAGGRVTSLSGGAPDYHIGYIAASNGLVHDELLRAIHA